MRSLRVLRNVVTNYLRFFLAGGIAFLLTPFMVRNLGDRDYGLWVTVFSLTGYFGLFDQGIRPSLVRYVSRDHAAGNKEGLGRTISSAIALYLGVGLVTMAVAAVVAANTHSWMRVDPALVSLAPKLVLIVGATLALGFPLGVFGAVLSGLQRYDIANGIGMVIGILRAVVFVVVLRMGGGLLALAWASLVVNLLGHVWSWIAARQLLPGVSIGARLVESASLRRIANYGGWSFVGAIAGNIMFQTDSLVITAFLGVALATPFALAAGLIDNARTLVHAAAWVLSPTASEMDTLGEGEKLRSMLITGSRYSVLVVWPVLLGLIVFGSNLLATWVGHRFEYASLLITVLAIPTMVSLPQSVASSLLFGIGKHRIVVILSVISALLNLGLSVWWAHSPGLMAAIFGTTAPPGLVGVAMGTAVPTLLVSGLAAAWFSCRALEMPFRPYVWSGMIQPGLVASSFLVPALALQHFWHPLGWGPLFVSCFGSWLVFCVVAWIWGVPRSDRARWSRMFGGVLRPAAAGGGGGGS